MLIFKKYIYILFLIFTFSCGLKNQESEKHNDSLNQLFKDSLGTIDSLFELSVIGVGDIMLGSNYPSNSSLPANDGKDILDEVSQYLIDADITTGNLEGTLLNSGGTPKVCDGCVAFRTPTHYAEYLKNAGFDVMNLANNHSNDMGYEGKKSTKETLEKNSIKYFGLRENPTTIIEIKNKKIGFAGFARNHFLNEPEKAAEIVKKLKSEVDILIVSVHSGAEGAGAQHVTKMRENYMGEERGNIFEFAHKMIDSGADVVFSHGPHVSRALELYNDRIIAYSLGNFCTYAKFGISGPLGLAPILKIFLNSKGEFTKGEIIPIKQIGRGKPVYDKSKEVIKIIKKLTFSDFPDTKLKIDDEGMILPNK